MDFLPGADATADEADYIDLLIASERVGKWIDTLKYDTDETRRKRALLELAEEVENREAYAEEARRAGAVSVLTSMLAKTDVSAELRDVATAVVKGLTDSTNQMRTFYYDGGLSVSIQEGALGDGVGVRVWLVAHLLSRDLISQPGIVSGLRVLELGSGCGVTGIVAAKLGAKQVFLTDHTKEVLLNLRACVRANHDTGGSGVHEADPLDDKGESDFDFDPEDADECDDFDDVIRGMAAEDSPNSSSWDHGNMHIRYLDWNESLVHMSGKAAKVEEPETVSGEAAEQLPPGIPIEDQFDVIIGTDIMYEEAMSDMLPAVISHRLRPGGRCILCNAVRDQALFDTFAAGLKKRGLQLSVNQIQPHLGAQEGIAGRMEDYEGGFIMMHIQHLAHPATDWHRDDLFGGNEGYTE